MLNGNLLRVMHQRRATLYASAAGIAVVAVTSVLTATLNAASATPRAAIPSSAISALKTNMLRLARQSGDAQPTSINAVATTRAQALRAATPGDTVPGSVSQRVYLVVMTGEFKVDAPTPPGASLPTGRYLAVTVSRSTFQVMDLGLSNHAPPVPLRTYGPVSNLTNKQG